MPLFRYHAVARTGERLAGEITASDEAAARRSLREQGHYPLDLHEASASRGTPWWQREITFGSRQDIGMLSRFALELATLLKAGLTTDRALQLSAAALPKGPLAASVLSVREAIRQGRSLADALQADRDQYPDLMISLARAGEVSGTLPDVMLGLAAHFDRVRDVRDKIRSALIYPAVLSVLAFLSIIFILLAVIPQFRPLLQGGGVDLPWTTTVLFAGSAFMEDYWLAVIAGVPVLVAATILLLRNPDTQLRLSGLVGRLRWIGPLIRASDSARFSRAMSILVSNGVPVPTAVDVARDTQASPHEAARLGEVNGAIRQGRTLAEALQAQGGHPDVLVELARVGEESGKLGPMLGHAADVLDRDLARRLDSFVTYLTPALTVLLGLIIGVLISSVFTALLSINELAV